MGDWDEDEAGEDPMPELSGPPRPRPAPGDAARGELAVLLGLWRGQLGALEAAGVPAPLRERLAEALAEIEEYVMVRGG